MSKPLELPLMFWPPSTSDQTLAAIGRIVFNFNACENTITQLLNILIGGDFHALVATAHMGTNTQLDALRTLTAEYLRDSEKEHVLHSIKLFERMRERRNYYIHSYSQVPGTPDTAGMGSWSARGRIKRHREVIRLKELQLEASNLYHASHYLALVHNHFSMPDAEEYQTLPAKFPLPDVLQKPFQFARGGGYEIQSYPRRQSDPVQG